MLIDTIENQSMPTENRQALRGSDMERKGEAGIYILIVENNIGEMDAVYKTLKDGKYDFGFVQTRENAIKMMAINLYEYVIMDYALPGMTGVEFQSKMRLNDFKARIIYTYPKATPSPEIKLKGCQWLGVPFFPQELLNLLNNK
jgi:CheY-like chemotaxis protein